MYISCIPVPVGFGKKIENSVFGLWKGILSTACQGSLVTVHLLWTAGPSGSEATELAGLVLCSAF